MQATTIVVKGRPATAQSFSWRMSASDALIYAVTFIPGIVLLAAVALQPRAPIAYLMKDPLAVFQMSKECCHIYYGAVSNLGVMIWTAGAAVCIFAALLLAAIGRRGGETVFLVAAGLFTGWLALDDLFMIHEDLLPLLGVPQPATYLGYGCAAATYLYLSWRYILALRPLLMALAMGLLGTSVAIDVLVHTEGPVHVFFEDGAKFLGILAWTGFHVTAALDLAAAALSQPRVIVAGRGT